MVTAGMLFHGEGKAGGGICARQHVLGALVHGQQGCVPACTVVWKINLNLMENGAMWASKKYGNESSVIEQP